MEEEEEEANVPTLGGFLSVTTIHGLRYLRGGPFGGCREAARFVLWSAAVVASASISGTIIVLNVQDWQRRPAVVTNVDYMVVLSYRYSLA